MRRGGHVGPKRYGAVVNVDLVVFDCDGVLVDSEALVVEVEAEMLTAAGFPITPDEIIERFVGLSYTTMMAELGTDNGRPVPDELSQRIQRAALDEFPARLRPVPGIDELLAGLALPRCVASSSDLDRIELSLAVTGLAGYFETDRIFSAQMVERGKPAPDLFELSASRLGVAPSRCLVIEDSPAGVTAAAAAGMEVVGFVAGGHASEGLGDRLLAAGASEVFPTAEKLAARIDS
jgi:HAD superfamily hydrolase (TIGR01509 family)